MLKRLIIKLAGGQRGFTFIEVIIGVLIIAVIASAFLMAIATAFKANYIAQVRTTADSLARAQLEYVKSQPYDYIYDAFLPIEAGYDVISWDYLDNEYSAINDNQIAAKPTNGMQGFQLIKVRVTHNDDTILELTQYRVDK